MDAHASRILIFGGTFDPPHTAHVTLPPLVADQLECDRILYVPAHINPLKKNEPRTDDAHRLAMLTMALADVPNAHVSAIELDRGGASYTIDTLKEMRSQYGPRVEMVLLIGADQALDFHKWKDWQQILELAEPAVLLRPPWDEPRFAEELRQRFDDDEAEQWMSRVAPVPILDISATEIRQRLRDGRSLDGMVDPAVAHYIGENRLYAQRASVQ